MEPNLKFIGKNLKKQPIVYGWRRGAIYLYIGQSKNGIGRIFSSEHAINNEEPLLDADIIDIWLVELKDLKKVEKELIRKFKPRYNVQGKHEYEAVCARCSKEFIATIEGQIYCSLECKFPLAKEIDKIHVAPTICILTGRILHPGP